VFNEAIEGEAGKRARSRDVRPLAQLAPYLARRRRSLLAALAFLVLAAGATLSFPIAARSLVDYGFLTGAASAINARFIEIGVIAAALAVFSAARFYFVTTLGERVVADLRGDVYGHLVGLSPAYFQRLRTGEALSRLTTDAMLIETLVGSSASVALRSAITTLGGLALLAATSPMLTGLLVLMVPAILIPVILIGRQVRTLSTQAQDRLAEAAGSAAESLDGIETVQAFGREDTSRQQFQHAVNAAFAASRKRIFVRSVLTALAIALVFGAIAFVLWLGAHQVHAGQMTPGQLTQFVFLAILVSGSAAGLAETWGDVQKAAGATQRLMEILAEEPDIATPVNPTPLPSPGRGEIRFDDVRFAYPAASDRSALTGLSFTVKPGETVAIVGPSGAGKSTVFRLLLRFYDPTGGRIYVDGVASGAADPSEWRKRFSYVAQDAALFSGSAIQNIRFGREEATTDEIIAAARAAEAEPFILQRPEGYEGSLGDRAKALSGGERQRLALARALVRNAPILLLDEATSALDAENERLIQRAIETASRDRTTLIIAHRLATVQRADRILVLDEGRLVEEGRHADLVARGGLYAKLARLQFAAAAE
jgi:ATP-binding cassette subfamily B protein